LRRRVQRALDLNRRKGGDMYIGVGALILIIILLIIFVL
jgi:hypothetical protein